MNLSSDALGLQSTGDGTLDVLLGGGIPKNSVTVIAGEPGSGKTVLTLQMLFNAARAGQKSIYFTTLSEPAVKVIKYMQLFSFFDAALLDEFVLFVDLGAAVRGGIERVVETIIGRVEAFGPDIVAIDSFRTLGDVRTEARGPVVYDLAVQLTAWGATTLIVGEYTRDEHSAFSEFAIADGIICLGSQQLELTSIRGLEILKLRGGNYVTARHFCEISSNGLAVYPRVGAPGQDDSSQVASAERASTGVEGLDEMLGGGFLRATTAVIQGDTGSGKTILGLHFLLEGARRGEKGILFTLEETPDQLRRIGQSLDLDLVEIEEKGLLTIVYSSPIELSTDRFLFDATKLVRELGAKRAVFDSLTSMALGVPSRRRFKEMAYSISKQFRQLGTTVVMTMEAEQIVGATKVTGNSVSFLADTLIQILYLERDGRLERTISVLKSRATKHLTELRRLTIDEGGIQIKKAKPSASVTA